MTILLIVIGPEVLGPTILFSSTLFWNSSAATTPVVSGMSSNAFGTMNKIKKIREILENHNCLLLLDAVHYAPHFSIDVNISKKLTDACLENAK